jgi:hypothetical protein
MRFSNTIYFTRQQSGLPPARHLMGVHPGNLPSSSGLLSDTNSMHLTALLCKRQIQKKGKEGSLPKAFHGKLHANPK